MVIVFSLMTGVFSGLRKIVRDESFRALYKSNGAQMIRIFPYASTQYTSYELYKKVIIILLLNIYRITIATIMLLLNSGWQSLLGILG